MALKVLPTAVLRDPERLARFQREAEVLASSTTQTSAPFSAWWNPPGARALVGWHSIEGPTLKDRIASERCSLKRQSMWPVRSLKR